MSVPPIAYLAARRAGSRSIILTITLAIVKIIIVKIMIIKTKVVAGAHNIHTILPEDTIQKRKVADMWKVKKTSLLPSSRS